MENNDNIIAVILISFIKRSKYMKISSLLINGIGGIKNLSLNFNEGLNIICGTNGIGKTTILECIATAFFTGGIKLTKNAQSLSGEVKVSYQDNDEEKIAEYKVERFDPNSNDHTSLNSSSNNILSDKILYFKPFRDINYQSLESVKRDINQKKHDLYYYSRIIIDGVKADDIKNWLINRYLFFDKDDSMTQAQKDNFNLSIECFSLMDSKVSFKTVIASTYEIMLATDKGDIYFEYLSAGYKSAIYILIGIIKEIEYRFNNPYIEVRDFEGLLLIDEIDVHLHPHWQAKLVLVLKELLPKAQIIATTHSPTVLQILETNEIIPLEEDDLNGVRLRDLNLGKYGLQGWTVEEILTDVMGLPSTSSDFFSNIIKSFDDAMNQEDKEAILYNYKLLNDMLHPKSQLRKLFKIQIAEWED